MSVHTFIKDDMSLKIRVTEGEPYFQTEDVKNSVGTAKVIIEEYLPSDRWVNYTELIGAIDKIERSGGYARRKRLNPIYKARVERFRNWIEWEVIPQLSKQVIG